MTRQDDIKTLIINHSRRLQKLKEQQALKGFEADTSIVMEIENIEAKIENLRQELENFEGDLSTSSQINILVVDDGEDWLHTISRLLNNKSYTVRTARSAKEVLEFIFDEWFDFAIIDVRLHGDDKDDVSGLILALAIKGINRQTQVIAITGYANIPQSTRALQVYNLDWFVDKSQDNVGEEILQFIARRLKNTSKNKSQK